MFSQQGSRRKYKHDLLTATLLSLVAGTVNVYGFLSVNRLTTSITGYFANFMHHFWTSSLVENILFFSFFISFFLGAFCSNIVIELSDVHAKWNGFVRAILLEIILLSFVVWVSKYWIVSKPDFIALLLLFSMGLQNAMVTKISDSLVRTTHLTGLFTDLGIDVAQLFFVQFSHRKKIIARVRLRLTIISSFFVGGLLGGSLYNEIHQFILIFPIAILIGSVWFSQWYQMKVQIEDK